MNFTLRFLHPLIPTTGALLEPVLGSVWGVVLEGLLRVEGLAEPLGLYTFLGGSIMLIGLAVLLWATHKRETAVKGGQAAANESGAVGQA